jgi:hypothetical protein
MVIHAEGCDSSGLSARVGPSCPLVHWLNLKPPAAIQLPGPTILAYLSRTRSDSDCRTLIEATYCTTPPPSTAAFTAQCNLPLLRHGEYFIAATHLHYAFHRPPREARAAEFGSDHRMACLQKKAKLETFSLEGSPLENRGSTMDPWKKWTPEDYATNGYDESYWFSLTGACD